VLGGCCTLIGTSTNLLVNDMAAVAGQPKFGIFEITPVGLALALAGGLYLLLFSGRLINTAETTPATSEDAIEASEQVGLTAGQVGSPAAFARNRPLRPLKAAASLLVFVAVIALAALNVAPIAACALAGAVLLILVGVITADEAYSGLRADVLMLIAGMLVLGIALRVSGVAGTATEWLVGTLQGLSPVLALILVYGATLFATELLSNATVAVLFTPVAVSLAEALHVSPRPFLVAVMIAGSAAFATPFGYQTNVLVYQIGRYNYLDFVKVGLPLNLITWAAAVIAITIFFPFSGLPPLVHPGDIYGCSPLRCVKSRTVSASRALVPHLGNASTGASNDTDETRPRRRGRGTRNHRRFRAVAAPRLARDRLQGRERTNGYRHDPRARQAGLPPGPPLRL
jgi:di/tricarboxylate transporter